MPVDAEVAEIRQTIKRLIAEEMNFPPDKLPEDLRLETLGLSSVMLMQAVSSIQDRFGTTLDPSALSRAMSPTLPFGTVLDELARYIGALR